MSKNYSVCSLSVFTTIPDTQKPKTERKDDTEQDENRMSMRRTGGPRETAKTSRMMRNMRKKHRRQQPFLFQPLCWHFSRPEKYLSYVAFIHPTRENKKWLKCQPRLRLAPTTTTTSSWRSALDDTEGNNH